MKATRSKAPPSFVPVTVTLETQREVDLLHAFLCHHIADGVGLFDQYKALAPFVSDDFLETVDELNNALKAYYDRQDDDNY